MCCQRNSCRHSIEDEVCWKLLASKAVNLWLVLIIPLIIPHNQSHSASTSPVPVSLQSMLRASGQWAVVGVVRGWLRGWLFGLRPFRWGGASAARLGRRGAVRVAHLRGRAAPAGGGLWPAAGIQPRIGPIPPDGPLSNQHGHCGGEGDKDAWHHEPIAIDANFWIVGRVEDLASGENASK